MGPHARLSPFWLCAASCPDRVLARKPCRQITAPVTARNFFLLPRFQSHRLQSPNAMPRRHASPGTRKAIGSISDRKLPSEGTALNHPCQTEHYRNRLAHDTPATLCMKRQTYYIIVIDIYNLRSRAELWRKLLLLGKGLTFEISRAGREGDKGNWLRKRRRTMPS